MAVRGIRGATTVESNTRDAVVEATRELLGELIRVNAIRTEDIASAWFTVTSDINAEFPAIVARQHFGWNSIALECVQEMEVPGSLRMCLRIMLHVNTERPQSEVCHVYLRGASVLRPDLPNGERA